MEYGVFQLDNENKLVLVARFNKKTEAEAHAKTGINMIILRFYS